MSQVTENEVIEFAREIRGTYLSKQLAEILVFICDSVKE